MRTALGELIADLADRSDTITVAAGQGDDGEGACSPLPMGPAPDGLAAAWTRQGAVLCVSGRGFLDEAAAAILAQILEKRGIGARTVPFAEASAARIGRFEPGPAQMTCVISLALDGEPTHLRRLIRRLKARMPGVPVLLGLWLAQEDDRAPSGAERSAGADAQAKSLRAVVEAVLAAAQAPATGASGAASAPEADDAATRAPAAAGA